MAPMRQFLKSLSDKFYHLPLENEVLNTHQRYENWMEGAEPRMVTLLDEQYSQVSARPLISIVMPVFNTPPDLLERAINSVICQTYENWQLCICDDASSDQATRLVLERYRNSNHNIEIVRLDVNSHISVATNTAMELAKGEWISFLDHDDALAPHALQAVLVAIDQDCDLKMIYSDEDKITEDGVRCLPFFKTDFDRLLLLGQNYVNHFLTIKKDEIERIGGLTVGAEGVQDWDLVLRVSENANNEEICHIPYVLYHWGIHPGSTASSSGSGVEQKNYIEKRGMNIVSDHLRRTRRDAEISLAPINYWVKVNWRLPIAPPEVEIVIPTKDGKKFKKCISSLLAKTVYPNYSVTIVDNGSSKPSTLKLLTRLATHPKVQVLRDPRPFNYSQLNNAAVQRSGSPLICLLNDDVEVIEGEWLSNMVGHIIQENVGVVGAKLLYPDMTIQHAGVLLGMHGAAVHVHSRMPDSSDGYFGNALLSRNVSCVTAACLLVHRELWVKLDGLDENDFAIAFNDVDFCLKVREFGKSIIWSANARLIHHESISRGPDTHGESAKRHRQEITALTNKWSVELTSDPFYNPNLSLNHSPYECGDSSRLLTTVFPVGSTFFQGQVITSPSGSFVAESMNSRLVVRNIKTELIKWASDEMDEDPFQIVFQHDGNLVAYSHQMRPLWASGSIEAGANFLELNDQGILALFDGGGDAYWSTE
jgi:O-antigen biosynthesis protein